MHLLTNTLSIFPMNGTRQESLTVAGKELVLCCVAYYTYSLASSSHN